jgi:hypothetical protein
MKRPLERPNSRWKETINTVCKEQLILELTGPESDSFSGLDDKKNNPSGRIVHC